MRRRGRWPAFSCWIGLMSASWRGGASEVAVTYLVSELSGLVIDSQLRDSGLHARPLSSRQYVVRPARRVGRRDRSGVPGPGRAAAVADRRRADHARVTAPE